MSDEIDVLDVVRRDAARLSCQQDSRYARQRANVIELIEAAKAATAQVMHNGTLSREACERLDAAWRACVAANA